MVFLVFVATMYVYLGSIVVLDDPEKCYQILKVHKFGRQQIPTHAWHVLLPNEDVVAVAQLPQLYRERYAQILRLHPKENRVERTTMLQL